MRSRRNWANVSSGFTRPPSWTGSSAKVSTASSLHGARGGSTGSPVAAKASVAVSTRKSTRNRMVRMSALHLQLRTLASLPAREAQQLGHEDEQQPDPDHDAGVQRPVVARVAHDREAREERRAGGRVLRTPVGLEQDQAAGSQRLVHLDQHLLLRAVRDLEDVALEGASHGRARVVL